MNPFIISSAILPKAINKEFYEYKYIPEIVAKLDVDGIELVFLPEWDYKAPPLTASSARWEDVTKVDDYEVSDFIIKHNINVFNVHCNRDIGVLLASKDQHLINKGQKILYDNLVAATKLKANLVVIHLWDTYSKNIDIKFLFNKVYEVSKSFPIMITYENIPISDEKLLTEDLWEELITLMPSNHGFTLDLNWSSLYDNYHKLSCYIKYIKNIHVQGYFKDNIIVPRVGKLDLLKSINDISLDYQGPITLELCKINNIDDVYQSINLLKHQRRLQ